MATQNEHKHGGRVVPLYYEWANAQGIPVIDGHYVRNLDEVELGWWPLKGGQACFVHHDKSGTTNAAYVCEIAPGAALEEQQHLYEEQVYVLKGEGKTVLLRPDGVETEFEWQRGSLFAIPLNVRYRHVNRSNDEPARFFGVNTMPTVLDLFGDLDFVFEDHYQFRSREEVLTRYLAEGRRNEMVWHRNFVPDLREFPLEEYVERGAGGRNIKFTMAKSPLLPHVSEFPVGTYKKGHRHGPGAYVVVLSGSGYSLMWPEGTAPNRYDWEEHSLIIPPDRWFHQHFNTGTERARYLALKAPQNILGMRNGLPLSSISIKDGGDQIDYEDEDPSIRELFAKELEAHDAELHM